MISPSDLAEAAASLKYGELVAFPTETVYGLGANAYSDQAVLSIFKTKGRPSDNPLIVHVPDLESCLSFVEQPDPLVYKLAAAFWPGPLSIVLPIRADSGLSHLVTAGLQSVGVRVPNHPVALSLLRMAGVPVAAPSANKSGSPSPTTAAHVRSDFPHVRVLDGGPCSVGLESTVVKVHEGRIYILRPGGVTKIALEICSGESAVEAFQTTAIERPEAPGMKYRHYAPKASVHIFDGLEDLSRLLLVCQAAALVIITFDDSVDDARRICSNAIILSLGCRVDLEEASRKIFGFLRACDDCNASACFIDCGFDKIGLGSALWNRISKAAKGASEGLVVQ